MTIIIDGSNFYIEPNPLHRISEVKRTQKILLLLISIVLGICVISFSMVIYALSINYRTNTYEPIIILCWILYFASGMLVTQRYYPTGLLIFGWLGILNIILTCVIIVCVTVGIVIITSQSPKQLTGGILFTASPIIVCLTSVILDAVIIIYSFKLWYLILKNLHLRDHQRI